MTVAQLYALLDQYAPFGAALSWDNSGILVGDNNWQVTKALISLDVTPNAVNKAIDLGADFILSHHPLIFSPLKSVTDPLLLKLIEHKIAVISMHTNLDVAEMGVNQILSRTLGLEVSEILEDETGSVWQHLSVIAPPDYQEAISEAAYKAGAGRIGSYDCCSTQSQIIGSFRPLQGSKSHQGEHGVLAKVDEIELEFMVESYRLPLVLKAIRTNHPYETPALYYYPVSNKQPGQGMGVICRLERPLLLSELVQRVKDNLHNPRPLVWNPGKESDPAIKTLALCGGSGNSLIKKVQTKAELFISGDLSYHNLLDSRIPIIDAGHFYTEYPVTGYLGELLSKQGIETCVLPMGEHEYIKNTIRGEEEK
ncbi:MAG: Nif3-like dinuclear metal center hexameric protein [Candidatus Cloacimonetes bacterium]|nr:Nif3-like dinuclear metal center hexameric protein [Candidatus Cloacimonadota bacterium]